MIPGIVFPGILTTVSPLAMAALIFCHNAVQDCLMFLPKLRLRKHILLMWIFPPRNYEQVLQMAIQKVCVKYISAMLQKKITCKSAEDRKAIADRVIQASH